MIGTPSFGLRLTTEKFYSPRGRSCSGVGVIPDIDITGTYSAARPESARALSLEDSQAAPAPASPVTDVFLSRALEESESLIQRQRSL